MNILISGALGKMGAKVKNIAEKNGANPIAGVDIKEDFSDKNFPVYSSFLNVKEKVDVVIDFSSPKNLSNVLDYCLKNHIPAVLCATGYTHSDDEQVKKASEKIAIFRSQNMSLGVNILLDLVKKATSKLLGYDIEIIEKHHNEKVDAPSGTALMLFNAIKEVKNEKTANVGRNGIKKREPDEVGISSVRGGTIVGEHEVIFAGLDEVISIKHQAFDRNVFAIGAINASKFILNKKNGLYSFKDVLEE